MPRAGAHRSCPSTLSVMSGGRRPVRQILRTSASVTVYNSATIRRAPAAPLRTVRNPITPGTAAAYARTSPFACLGQVNIGEGVTACSQQRCARLYAANGCSVSRRERRRSDAG